MTLCAPAAKVMSWDAARMWRQGASAPVAFTNGVFDLLHRGHVDVLAAARACGQSLIVAVNSDASVARLKGPSRPLRTAADRAYVLAALECVDAVVVFEEDTPRDLVRHLRPDVLVKGGDYTPETVVGRDDVESWGGRVVIVPLTPGHSTTATVRRLRADG